MRSRLRIAVSAWWGSLVLLASIQAVASAEQVVFTIDPGLSNYAITAVDSVHGALVPQGAGAGETSVAGHFLVDFDPLSGTPTSLTFVANHGFIDLAVSGNWLPGPGGVGGAAPADIGLATPSGNVKFAARNLAWDWTSGSVAIGAGGSFDETQVGYTVLSGSGDFVHPDVAPGYGSIPYTGASGTLEEAGTATLIETSPGVWTLTMAGDVTTNYNTDTLSNQGTIIYSAHTVATAQFGSNNVDDVAPAETMADALGGSSTVGGVSATLSSSNTGGTFSVQQIPNQTGLPQEALVAAEVNPVFAVSTAALASDPQIWNVDFDGDLGGTIELVFHYDSSLLPAGLDELTLGIWHFNSNTSEWEFGGTVDPVADTITYSTDNLSPFQLGVVPEPSTVVLAAMGLVGLAAGGRRRRKR